MRKLNVTSVLDRLKRVTGTDTDTGLAAAVGVSPQTLSSWKVRESIPYSICVALAQERNISLDWLLIDQGPMLRGVEVREATPDTLQDPRESAVLAVFRALDEDDQRFIQHAAEEKKRLRDLEQRLQDLSRRFDTLGGSR